MMYGVMQLASCLIYAQP